MGSREIRLVPEDYKHPKDSDGVDIPMLRGDYQTELAAYNAKVALWEKGFYEGYNDIPTPKTELTAANQSLTYEEWDDVPPNSRDYVYQTPPIKADHYMLFETVTEGCPAGGVRATLRELITLDILDEVSNDEFASRFNKSLEWALEDIEYNYGEDKLNVVALLKDYEKSKDLLNKLVPCVDEYTHLVLELDTAWSTDGEHITWGDIRDPTSRYSNDCITYGGRLKDNRYQGIFEFGDVTFAQVDMMDGIRNELYVFANINKVPDVNVMDLPDDIPIFTNLACTYFNPVRKIYADNTKEMADKMLISEEEVRNHLWWRKVDLDYVICDKDSLS